MHWKRTLQLVDVHCEGEIGRVITSGVLDIPGATVADKLAHINTTDDSLRRALVLELRGGPTVSVVLLLPATRPEADVGFILFLADQAYPVSGSNIMCAATALIETGAIEMVEPETPVVFDTAAGLVTAVANGANKVGDTLATRSIIGGEFKTRITDTARVGSFEAIRSTLSGRC